MTYLPREVIAAALSHALIGDPSYAQVFSDELTRYVKAAPPRDASDVLCAIERACIEARKALGQHGGGMDPRLVAYDIDMGPADTNLPDGGTLELLVDVLQPGPLVAMLLGAYANHLGTTEVRMRIKGRARILQAFIHTILKGRTP